MLRNLNFHVGEIEPKLDELLTIEVALGEAGDNGVGVYVGDEVQLRKIPRDLVGLRAVFIHNKGIVLLRSCLE